jgi:hypothetical protein
MSQTGFTLILAVAFGSGWICCSYFEAQARIDRAKARRKHPSSNR